MTPNLAGAIGGALLMIGAIWAMAALSHCPRRLRVWPALLLGLSALLLSDRTMKLLALDAPLEDVRSWLTVLAIAAACGTVVTLSWVIQHACPVCNKRAPISSVPRWLADHIQARDGK